MLNVSHTSFWTNKPAGFTDAETSAFRKMIGTSAARSSLLGRANRVLAVELSDAGNRRFMILNGIYLDLAGDLIANYGNSPHECQPVRVGQEITHGFTTVTWKSQAEEFGFLFSPTDQVDWTRPDGTPFEPDEVGLTAPRNSASDSATIVAMPKALLLHPGVPGTYHGRPVNQAMTPTERIDFPEVAAFVDAVSWLHNNGENGLGPANRFVAWANIDESGWSEAQIPVNAMSPVTSVNGVSTRTDTFRDYLVYYKGFTQRLSPLVPTTSPTATTPAQPTKFGPSVGDIHSAMMDAISHTKRSQTEQESLDERVEAGMILRLLFCRRIKNPDSAADDTVTPFVLQVPKLDELFEKQVLLLAKNVQATKNMAKIWLKTGEDSRAILNPPMLTALHEAHETLITEFFVANLRAGEYSTHGMEMNPNQIRTTISLALFGPPSMTVAEYEATIEHGRLIHQQISQGEDTRNQAKKATCHNPKIRILTRHDLTTTVAALAAFERTTIRSVNHSSDQECSVLLELLLAALQHLVRSRQAEQWFRKNENFTSAIHHIFLDFQAIFGEVALWATSPRAMMALKDSRESDDLTTDSNIIRDADSIRAINTIRDACLNSISSTYTSMSGNYKKDWMAAPSITSYLGGLDTPSKRKQEATPLVSPTNGQSPPKKQRGPHTGNEGTPVGNSTGTRTPITADERRRREGLGILTYSGTGVPPIIPLALKELNRPKTRYICRDFVTRGRACEATPCRHGHIRSFGDLDQPSATQLKAWITAHEHYNFATPSDAPNAPRHQACQTHPLALRLFTSTTVHSIRYPVKACTEPSAQPVGHTAPTRMSPSYLPDGRQEITTGASVGKPTPHRDHHACRPRLIGDDRAAPLLVGCDTTTRATNHGSSANTDPSPASLVVSKKTREDWARSHLPRAVSDCLWSPHGKETKDLSFVSSACFQHALPHLFASGFMSRTTRRSLCTVSRPARTLDQLLRLYANVDYAPLRDGLPPASKSGTQIMQEYQAMFTACFLQFNCWTPHVLRYIGGQHTGEHRAVPQILQELRDLGVDDTIITELATTLRSGAPRYFNSEYSASNLAAALRYGNHPSISDSEEAIQTTKQCFEKDVKKGFAITLDIRLLHFIPHLHLTPIGLLVARNKKPRIYFDSSFRPKPWSMAINDSTDLAKEPTIHFATAFATQLAWIWNLRITYPREEIYLGDDDVSGAFRQVKYNPNVVSLHSCQLFGALFMYTGQTFGDSPSPANWEPIVSARKALAQKLWTSTDVILRGREVLPDINMTPLPDQGAVKEFVIPSADSFNSGVMDPQSQARQPPPYPHHVDDCYYADIRPYFYKTVVSSLLALYTILGKRSVWNSDVVSWDKFNTEFTHQRRINGWIVDSRALTLTLPDDKRSQLRDLLKEWNTKLQFSIRELAVLLGLLTDHSKPIPWFRARYASLFFELRRTLQHRHRATYHYAYRHAVRAKWDDSLPSDLKYRLSGIVATEVASQLWRSKIPIKITAETKQEIARLTAYAWDPAFRWEGSIGHMIKRDPDFESWGDASLLAGGGFSRTLKFYFLLFWGPRIQAGFDRPPAHPEYRHINDMEFVVIIVQLAACLTWMRQSGTRGIAPTALFWSDNTSSTAWACAVHAKSPRQRGLIALYSQLLEFGTIKPRAEHITTTDNHQADFISRLEPGHSPFLLHQQISHRYSEMISFRIFLPSSELLSTIVARMYSDVPLFLARLGETQDWTLANYSPRARVKVFALWTADLAAGETLICRSIKAATIGKYLHDAAKFIGGFTGSDPRMELRGEPRLHPWIQGVLKEVIRYEKIPDKREPHTPKMQSWFRSQSSSAHQDSLLSALTDWGALGLILGPRISEWAQEDGYPDPTRPKLAPNGGTYAFTWADVTARLGGNKRVPLDEVIALDDISVESITVTFTWQKNGNHGEQKLLVRNDTSPDLCPVRAMLSILRRYNRLIGRDIVSSPLAVYRDSPGSQAPRAITAREVASHLRIAAQHTYGIDPTTPIGRADLSRWSSHSLRVGACVILHINGFSGPEIQFLLRWSSDAFMQYLRNVGTLARKQNDAISYTDNTMPTLMV